MRILIVDDEKNSIKSIQGTLKRLGHKVDAIEYLDEALELLMQTQNLWKYDLILVDELFKNNANSRLKEGAELCRELNSSEIFFTPIISFTGHIYTAQKATEILGDYGCCYFFEKTEFDLHIGQHRLSKITSLPGFRRIWLNRTWALEKAIQSYFQHLDQQQITPFLKEAQKGKEADWAQDALQVELDGGKYTLTELLEKPGLGLDIENVSSQVLELLKTTKHRPKLSGDWTKKEKGIEAQLDKYWSMLDYSNEKTKINRQALDYFLNVLLLNSQFEEGDERIRLTLNKRHSQLKVTNNCTGNMAWTSFKEKLVGRRVAFAFQEKIGFGKNGSLGKLHLAALLRQGDTNEEVDIKTAPIFSTHLGLTTNQSNQLFLLDDDDGYTYIMTEERKWLESEAKDALILREFLAEIHNTFLRKFKDLKFVRPSEYEFTDLADFEEYLSDVKKQISQNDIQQIKGVVGDRLKAIGVLSVDYLSLWFPVDNT